MVASDCFTRENEETRESEERDNDTLSIEGALSLLSNQLRRRLLHLLRDHAPETVSLDAALEELASQDQQAPDDFVESRESAHVLLRHNHIPKLEEEGVVSFDGEGALQYLGDPVLDEYLDFTEELER